MLHIVKQLRITLSSFLYNGLMGSEVAASADTNNNDFLSWKEIKEYNWEKAEELRAYIANLYPEGLEDDQSVAVKDIVLEQWTEIVSNMKKNNDSKKGVLSKTQDSVSSLKESINLSQIDTSKFTRTLNEKSIPWDDIAELNKFLLLKTGMFSFDEIPDLKVFSTKTYSMLWNYQSNIGYKSPDGELTISWKKEYRTLFNIKKDVKWYSEPVAPVKTNTNVEEKTKVDTPVKKDAPIRTLEETDVSLEITAWSWNEDFAWLKENINNASYEGLVKSMSFSELKTFISKMNKVALDYQVTDSDGKPALFYGSERVEVVNNKITYLNWDIVKNKAWNTISKDDLNNRNSFWPFSFDMKNVFLDAWYDADGIFAWIEIGSLIELFNNVYITQLNLKKSTSFKDKISVIFDYNQDGLLDNDVHFYTKEKQLFNRINTEEDFENFISKDNMGYKSVEDFYKWFEDNYFAARAEFKTKLWWVLWVKNPINPQEMINDANALSDFNKHKEEVKATVDTEIDSHKYTKNLSEEVKAQIRLQSVWLLLWSKIWAWISFDISEVTNGILDSLAFWVVNGMPWIGIWKRFKSENGKLTLDMWIVNFIPVVWVTGIIKESEIKKMDNLFANDIDSTTQVTIGWSISSVWGMVGVDFSTFDEWTKKWIEMWVSKMSETLDKIFDEIKAGKSFEESSFSKNPQNKAVYNGLLESYNGKEFNIPYLKEGTLKNYERVLYENADGFNYVWTTVWLAFVAGFLPIPLILVHWETHSTEWKKVSSYSKTIQPEGLVDGHLEDRDVLLNNISKYEDAFSDKTRWNWGALALMEPKNNLKTRWEWLVELSNSTWALKKVGLSKFLSTVWDDNKLIVMSTFTQFMKRAKDFANGDINLWNTNTEKYISIDNNRREGFNEMFGFSLSEEAKEYNKLLLDWKWKIGKTKKRWLWFDATASKQVQWKSVKWIDTLYADLNVLTVNGEFIYVTIDNKAKIEAFKQTISNLGNLSPDLKKSIIDGIDNWTMELRFYKDPDGFDDRILPVVKGSDSAWAWVEVFQPDYNTVSFGLWYMWDKDSKKDWGNGEGWVTSKPGEEETAWADTNWVGNPNWDTGTTTTTPWFNPNNG